MAKLLLCRTDRGLYNLGQVLDIHLRLVAPFRGQFVFLGQPSNHLDIIGYQLQVWYETTKNRLHYSSVHLSRACLNVHGASGGSFVL